MKNEVKTYDQHLRGEVFGYQVESPSGKEMDSCWGFYGYNHEESGLLEYAQNAIDYDIEQKKKEHFEQLKKWIKSKTPLQYRKPFCLTI